MTNQQNVREALSRLPTENLQRGMRAFEHPSRMSWQPTCGDATGCFMWEAMYKDAGVINNNGRLEFIVPAAKLPEVLELSGAYEMDQAWFKGECLRELAERGGAPEPAARREEAQCLAIT